MLVVTFLFKATVVTETPRFILINTDMKNLWALNSQFEISFNIIAIFESKISIAVRKKQSLGTKGRNLIHRLQDNKVGPV